MRADRPDIHNSSSRLAQQGKKRLRYRDLPENVHLKNPLQVLVSDILHRPHQADASHIYEAINPAMAKCRAYLFRRFCYSRLVGYVHDQRSHPRAELLMKFRRVLRSPHAGKYMPCRLDQYRHRGAPNSARRPRYHNCVF